MKPSLKLELVFILHAPSLVKNKFGQEQYLWLRTKPDAPSLIFFRQINVSSSTSARRERLKIHALGHAAPRAITETRDNKNRSLGTAD